MVEAIYDSSNLEIMEYFIKVISNDFFCGGLGVIKILGFSVLNDTDWIPKIDFCYFIDNLHF